MRELTEAELQEVESYRENLYRSEEPHIEPGPDGEETCYQSCSAETSRQAIENVINLIKAVQKIPNFIFYSRTGGLAIGYYSKDSTPDGLGHMINGEEFYIEIGPSTDEPQSDHQAYVTKTGAVATDFNNLWVYKGKNLNEITSKLNSWLDSDH